MREVLEFVGGGGLLLLMAWMELHHCKEFVPHKLDPWARKVVRVLLIAVAVAALLDPLIPGPAGLKITVPTSPSTYPTLLENLRVRVMPVGLRGFAGGDRVVDAAFDRTGAVDVVSRFALLETRVAVDVYDATRPFEIIRSTTVWVSPFCRRQLVDKVITP